MAKKVGEKIKDTHTKKTQEMKTERWQIENSEQALRDKKKNQRIEGRKDSQRKTECQKEK